MTGSKTVIKKFLQAVMNSGQQAPYPNPGLPIHESQIDYKHTGSAQPRTAVRTDS